ncbi:MAG: hypothetical protein IJS50_06180, partial [Desulfovibrio sp.]|nr:hypothetical protein [Desulfovibrio sp.]
MSQLHLPQGANSYSLRQFENLANRSQDNQELRIRKSNQELSNTPLGFISRHGVMHANSNVQVNQAFLHAIINDKRYQCVADQLLRTLSKSMPLTSALTAAKVKSAVNTAKDLVQLYKEGSKLAGTLCDQGIIPNKMLGEFTSFYVSYCAKNPDQKPDLKDFGDPSQLTQEHQGLNDFQKQDALRQIDNNRLYKLRDLLQGFFYKGNRLQRTGFFGFRAEDCGNDAEKAKKLNALFNKTCKHCPDLNNAEKREDVVARMFDIFSYTTMPTSGSITSVWQDELHNAFFKDAQSAWSGCKSDQLAFLSNEDLSFLLNQVPLDASVEQKQVWLNGLESGLKHFFDAYPQDKAPGSEKLSSLVRHLCACAKGVGQLDDEKWGQKAAADFMVLEQLAAKSCDKLLKENGLEGALGLAALRGSDFRQAASNVISGLSKNNRTAAEIERIVQEQAKQFLEAHGEVLRTLDSSAQNFNEHQLDMLVRVTVPFASLSKTLTSQQSSEVALLRETNFLADKFFSPGMSADDRSLLVKTLTKALLGGEDAASCEKLCQNIKPRLEGLLAELKTLQRQAATNQATRECCDKTVTLLNVIYATMLDQVAYAKQKDLLLNPKPNLAANPNLAMQMEPPKPGQGAGPLRPVPRKATSAEIFAAAQHLEAHGDKKLAEFLLPFMEKTHCSDTALLNTLSGHPINRVATYLSSMHSVGDYATSYKHFYNDIHALGSVIQEAVKKFPHYSSGEISKLLVDMFIATHTDEQLGKLLHALQSPE